MRRDVAAFAIVLIVAALLPVGPALIPPPAEPATILVREDCGHPIQGAARPSLSPAATGTVADYPEMGLRLIAPTAHDMQSSYVRTTPTNREFRRGFLEFAIPRMGADLRRATLTFAEGPGVTVPGDPPPVKHELSWYRADLEVRVDDYDRPTVFVAPFQDDLTDANSVWCFDVTEEVRLMEGGSLGFRMKLVADPDFADFGGLGTSFGAFVWQPPEIRLTLA